MRHGKSGGKKNLISLYRITRQNTWRIPGKTENILHWFTCVCVIRIRVNILSEADYVQRKNQQWNQRKSNIAFKIYRKPYWITDWKSVHFLRCVHCSQWMFAKMCMLHIQSNDVFYVTRRFSSQKSNFTKFTFHLSCCAVFFVITSGILSCFTKENAKLKIWVCESNTS